MSEILENRHKPENVNHKHKQALGTQDRIALTITTAVGTMYAVYFLMLCLAGWMLWQGYFSAQPFDPYPFVLLLMITAFSATLLAIVVLINQNRQGKMADIRQRIDFEVNVRAEN